MVRRISKKNNMYKPDRIYVLTHKDGEAFLRVDAKNMVEARKKLAEALNNNWIEAGSGGDIKEARKRINSKNFDIKKYWSD